MNSEGIVINKIKAFYPECSILKQFIKETERIWNRSFPIDLEIIYLKNLNGLHLQNTYSVFSHLENSQSCSQLVSKN